MIKWIVAIVFTSIFQVVICQELDFTDKKVVDTFIEKYGQEKFSEFDKAIISVIDENEKESVYSVGKIENELPLYFVTYDCVNKKVQDIDKLLLENARVDNYFKDKELEAFVVAFRKYNFSVLGKDEAGNIFIVPSPSHKLPFFLKTKNLTTNDVVVKLGITYKHYKDNWYMATQ